MLKDIIKYISKNKLSYLLVTISLLIEYSILLVPTKIIQFIVDEITNGTLDFNKLMLSLFILLASTVIAYFAGYYWIYKLYTMSNTFLFELRLKMFEKFLNMRQSFYSKFKTGDMLTRFTNDGKDYQVILGYGATNFLFAIAYIIFVLPAMFAISIKISLIASMPIIIGGIIIYNSGKKYDSIAEKEREALSNLSNEVLEMVEGVRVIRAYSNSQTAYKIFKEKTNSLRKMNNNLAFYSAVFAKFPNILSGLCMVIVVYFGAYSLFKGELSLGQLIAIQLYSLMLLYPMWILTEFILVYKMAKVSHQRINELLNTSDDLSEDGIVEMQSINTIKFKNYSFKYNSKLPLSLENINFTLNKGETLGIIGKTGSGKTSLIRQLLVQFPIGYGEILINEIPLEKYKRSSVEKLISYVPQEHFLFSKSVLENIKIGKEDASEEEINSAIKSAAFDSDIENLSEGMNTLVGEKGVSISGGQKQRILIARAFLKNSDLLILDDSLSAVDAKTEQKIISELIKLRSDKTNIIVTHRLSAIKNANKVIVMDNGNIVEYGTPNELFDKKGWYYEQYIRQDLEGGER